MYGGGIYNFEFLILTQNKWRWNLSETSKKLQKIYSFKFKVYQLPIQLFDKTSLFHKKYQNLNEIL